MFAVDFPDGNHYIGCMSILANAKAQFIRLLITVLISLNIAGAKQGSSATIGNRSQPFTFQPASEDNLPTFTPAGEHSASRFNAFLFGAAYYPEQWPESYWEQDARRMQECGANVVRIGEFAWALMEPEEGKYDFSLFDRAIATMAAHGIKVTVEPRAVAPTGSQPN